MRRFAATLGVAALALVGAFVLATPTPARFERASCGVERWSVKTLQDPAGRTLDLSMVKKTTVSKLRAFPVARGAGGSRGQGVESTVYEIKARLVEAKLEDDDDIHLVVKGLPTVGGTMIVEFPTVACSSKAATKAKTLIKQARDAFVAACGMPGSSGFRKLSGTATLRGVGFFDFLHGQRGVAPNGIELHPVLAFTKASCQLMATTQPQPPPPAVLPPPPPPVTPPPPPPAGGNCAPSYPTVCIAPPPPDLDCKDIPYRNFKVRYDVPDPDPHRFDGDRDGVGCES
jgi:hypothetical protein